MTDLGHDSVEEAAMEGFPKAHCRVVASRTFEDDGYVLLDTGSPGRPYLYASWPRVVAIRENAAWKPESEFGLALRVAVERGDVRRDTA